MPLRRRHARRTRRPFRTLRRKRTSKRKIYRKNNNTQIALRGKLIPNQLFVKLPWSQDRFFSVSAGTVITVAIGGNYCRTPELDVTSISNHLNFPSTNFPMGLIRYGSFYKNFKVAFSKLAVQLRMISGETAGANPVCRCTLLTSTGVGLVGDSQYDDLVAAPYDSTVAWPGARMGTLGAQSSSRGVLNLKKAGSSKRILGFTNLKDFGYSQPIPTIDNQADWNRPYVGGQTWMYLLRIENSSALPIQIELTYKALYYCYMYGRDFLEQFEYEDPSLQAGSSKDFTAGY